MATDAKETANFLTDVNLLKFAQNTKFIQSNWNLVLALWMHGTSLNEFSCRTRCLVPSDSVRISEVNRFVFIWQVCIFLGCAEFFFQKVQSSDFISMRLDRCADVWQRAWRDCQETWAENFTLLLWFGICQGWRVYTYNHPRFKVITDGNAGDQANFIQYRAQKQSRVVFFATFAPEFCQK